MTDAPKLTKAQSAVYNEVQSVGHLYCMDDYKPALKLIEMGLVSYSRQTFGQLRLGKIGGKND